ncbi:hypothetical protein SAMN02745120_0088 [Acetoanaerobium noterae]|uniref:Helicase HerA central domain-containing protein n=1 Tax=Acetoanaerobium noterae TaxID=745369 RepID=A0A1T5DNC7_9FIRM|nr:DUF87 domain-containing protein [Acetoanaerobium noterae]SKB73090.1 hypothetical protein SAMN02745120_0088 [Acetoanaerobium noterae]
MDKYIGKLIGNTGDPSNIKIALENSFSAKRGEFVKIKHTETEEEGEIYVLGRIVAVSRSNILYNSNMGDGLTELEILPGASITGETLYGTIQLVGYRDSLGRIKIPRRPLNPGEKVFGVDYEFLAKFYKFDENTSINIGNLIGYEKGENIVPVYLDVNKLVTEHLAVLAMTGSGKSYTVGRVIEKLVAEMNGTVVVFDVHGEYGKAFNKGNIHFNDNLKDIEDPEELNSIKKIQETLQKLLQAGGGIKVYTPQMDSFDYKYSSKNIHLSLQFDRFDMDDLSSVLPGLTEPQQRVIDVAIRYWKTKYDKGYRDIQDLIYLLTDSGLEELKHWDKLTEGEANALNNRSAAVVSMKLSRMINEARSFYTRAKGEPTDIYKMIGEKGNRVGRLVIVDLQGLSDDAKQIITALISSEIMRAAADKERQTRPAFLVYEEGHNFAPAGMPCISKKIIKKIAAEGRKFGVGFSIISQRPSKLDPDVTSQCNTIITMRLKNPDDQRFIAKTSDMFSKSDIEELPSLSTGEALICGRSIPAPLLVKIGTKALLHGGESPQVIVEWGSFNG